MIVPITGNVQYTITLDPTVWIFDDRKVLLKEAFTSTPSNDDESELKKKGEIWDKAIEQGNFKPPVNKSISKLQGEKILTESYVMPIHDFINHAEVHNDAKEACLVTQNSEIVISLNDLKESYLLFAINGKPLTENGPVQLYYKNGSNKDNPIKGIKKIVIK